MSKTTRKQLFEIPFKALDTLFETYDPKPPVELIPLIKQVIKASMFLADYCGVSENPFNELKDAKPDAEKISDLFCKIIEAHDLPFDGITAS